MASESLAPSEIEVRSEMRKTQEKIEKVEVKIQKVEDKIQKVETALEEGLAYLGSTDHVWIRNELALLREEKRQLQEKELRLMPAPQPPAASGILVQGMQRLEEMLQALCSKQEETKTRLVSSAGQEMWEELRVAKSLSMQPAPIDFAEGVEPKEAPNFEWDNRSENVQSDRYMEYLETHITLPRGQIFVDVKKFPNLLDWSDGLPFRVRGTTDAVVCLETAVNIPQTSLLALFELKKQVPQPQHRYQALVQLLLANLRCPTFRPWVVLSDLKSSWEFFWLDGSIVKFVPVERPNALAIIETALNRQSVEENSFSGAMEVTPEEGVRGPLQKRRRVREAISGTPTAEQDLAGFEDVLKGDMEREWLTTSMRKLAAVFSMPSEAISPSAQGMFA